MNLRQEQKKVVDSDNEIIIAQRAIIAFMSSDPDYKKLMLEYANSYPVNFYQAFISKDNLLITNSIHISSELLTIMTEINQCVIDGKKISAIKLFREFAGYGLKQAKNIIDEYSIIATSMNGNTNDQATAQTLIYYLQNHTDLIRI